MKEETTNYTVPENPEPAEIKMNGTEDRKDEKKEKDADFSFTVKANFKDVFVIIVLILMVIYFFRGCEILLKRLGNQGTNIESVESTEAEK